MRDSGVMKVVHAEGSPEQRGRAIGEGFTAELHAVVAFTESWAVSRNVARPQVAPLVAPYETAARRVLPIDARLLTAIAETAGIDPVWWWATIAFEELYGEVERAGATATLGDRPERCTDAVVPGPDGPLVIHQEQWFAGDDGGIGVLVDTAGAGVVGPVTPMAFPLVGMNGTGAAVGVMSLSAGDERAGVPRALVARGALDASDADDAWRRATLPERAGGYSYCWGFPDGSTAIIETSAARASRLGGSITHTNHALDASLGEVCHAPSMGSLSRLARIDELVEAHGNEPWTVEEAQAILADHAATGMDICMHPDPADGIEADTVMFGMVGDVANRRLWVAPGHPCTSAWECFEVADLLA
jgi:Acyl-coenzyme A:6-aminopenicillanic acid acyl-transferase